MKHDKEVGSIAPGKLADLAILDGKPDADIAHIERVVAVVKGGVVYQTAGIHRTLGIEAPVAR